MHHLPKVEEPPDKAALTKCMNGASMAQPPNLLSPIQS